MNNIPEKIYYHLGYNNLGLLLDQERKHWLMKVDKQKQVQDKTTGEIYEGTVNNLASDIVIESERLNITNEAFASLVYTDPALNKMLEVSNSAFTYSYEVNGFMFARILSINYQTSTSSDPVIHHAYRLKLQDCEECIIPFGGSPNTDSVFADRWLKTSTVPIIQLMDDNSQYTIEVQLDMDNCTNPVFYYPLNTTIQPFELILDNDVYYTEGINDDDYIGMPLYWFTCDETNMGPKVTIANNHSILGRELCMLSNPGNGSKYDVKMYVGVDGDNDATPDDSLTSTFAVVCKSNQRFTDTEADFMVNLPPEQIIMKNTTTDEEFSLGISFGIDENSVIRMTPDVGWEYVDDSTYMVQMSVFDTNCLEVGKNALIPVFDLTLDTRIPFITTSESNVGYAGVRMGSSNEYSDIYPRYPHHLNEWEGLPTWINELDPDMVPQHLCAYAIHNTKDYVETIPDSRQVAALLLDPGKKKTDDHEGFTNDERGRVYVISNDDLEYRNNLVEKINGGLVKPDRTAARICDIPTSVMQLSGISGLSPSPIVDKKYVRSQASFTNEDKERLWNEVNWMDRWVRPTAFANDGERIIDKSAQEGDKYVFHGEDMLNLVDMNVLNDFNIIENLNPTVESTAVSVAVITNGGENYSVTDIGKIIIGGYSFTYEVEAVDAGGVVTEVLIAGDFDQPINLSNFDMLPGNSGITAEYGTSPTTPQRDPEHPATGLKVQLLISGYADLLPKKGDYLDGLHAFVRCDDGIWLYEWESMYDSYYWRKGILVSPFEQSTEDLDRGLSTHDAYVTSQIPIYSQIDVSKMKNFVSSTSIEAFVTPTFINITDTRCTPVTPNESSSQDDEGLYTKVDICKFKCDGVRNNIQAVTKTDAGVLDKLKELDVLRYDSYVFWKWNNANDPNNLAFSYGIIYRSLSNYQSTDVRSRLPKNNLKYKKYVHSNYSTTVVWDAPGVNGVMMWIYDPTSRTKEMYVVDPETQDLYVDRDMMTWNDVDIYNNSGNTIKIVDDDGIFQYNILSNNPGDFSYTPSGVDVIYQQPEFRKIVSVGTSTTRTSYLGPSGNWKLVFPRCDSYQLTNVTTGEIFKPVKLQLLRGENLGSFGDVKDENGNTVNNKTLILNQTSTGTSLNVFNEQTGRWETV